MLKRHLMKLVVGLALVLTLLGGIVALSHATSAASAAPARPVVACGVDTLPPCT